MLSRLIYNQASAPRSAGFGARGRGKVIARWRQGGAALAHGTLRGRGGWALLVLLWLPMCAPPPRSPRQPAPSAPIEQEPKRAVEAPRAPPPIAEVPVPESDPARADEVPLWLPKFYAALHAIDQGDRDEHVRVLWFGDSHTAADFWTHAVRQQLQSRFGAGGAGLVLPGLKYRHGLARLSRSGKWQMLPRSPAATWPQGDGSFGLAGVVAVPLARNAAAVLQPVAGSQWARGGVRWQVLYRPTSAASAFRIRAGDDPPIRVQGGAGQARPSGLYAIAFETPRASRLVLDDFVDAPQLFGVIIESSVPGLVIDTLGINGARAATPLSWDAEAWVNEVRARAPDLVVLAYGTNEVGDSAPVASYRQQYEELLGRLRRAGPKADCLLIGPTDRARKDWSSEPRVAQIDDAQRELARELGCAYFSVLGCMGGPGGLRRWAFETHPQLARRDRVHLLPLGYRRLGKLLAEQLLASYALLYTESEVVR